MQTSTSKVRVEQILVNASNTALPAAGTALFSGTGLTNLTVGQIGIYDADTLEAIGVGTTVDDSPNIIIARADKLAASYPLPRREVTMTKRIGPDIVSYTGVSYAAPVANLWMVGIDNATATGQINVTNDVLYQMILALDGRRTDIVHGRNTPAIYGKVAAKDYTAYTDDDARDEIVQNMVLDINSQNNTAVLALAIDSAAAGTGLALSGATVGVEVTVATLDDGTVLTHVLTAAEANAIANAVTAGDLTGSWEIVNATSTATQASIVCDIILLLALDATPSFYDRVKELRHRVVPGLSSGFAASVENDELTSPFEGSGTSRWWELQYQSAAGPQKFGPEQAPFSRTPFQFPSPVVDAATYDVYSIVYNHGVDTTASTKSFNPFVAHILVPIGNTAFTTSFEAVLNPWMASVTTSKGPVNL